MSTQIYVKFTSYSSANKSSAVTGNVTAKGFEGSIRAHSVDFGVAQTLNIGSQSSGAGAGKVTFNKAAFTKDLDAATPLLFQALASGTPYEFVDFFFVTADNRGNPSLYATCRFKLVALASLDWSGDQDTPAENVGIEYGALVWSVATPSGGTQSGGWNRVKNVGDTSLTTPLS